MVLMILLHLMSSERESATIAFSEKKFDVDRVPVRKCKIVEVGRMEMFEEKEKLAPIIFENHSADMDVGVLQKIIIHRFYG